MRLQLLFITAVLFGFLAAAPAFDPIIAYVRDFHVDVDRHPSFPPPLRSTLAQDTPFSKVQSRDGLLSQDLSWILCGGCNGDKIKNLFQKEKKKKKKNHSPAPDSSFIPFPVFHPKFGCNSGSIYPGF
jgi:hypothetical protein